MKKSAANATVLIDHQLAVGEGPCWDAQHNALWFVDITAPALYRLDAATNTHRRWTMPSPVGSCGLAADGRIVVALRTGVHLFDPARESLVLIANPEPDHPTNRLNDGKVGPDGRFWVGSMDDRSHRDPTGALYRIDVAGRCDRLVDGLIISNGLAWSPDARTMYHADSRAGFIQAFDFEVARGAICNQRRLCMLDDATGRPDGAACDVEGFYWSAGVTAGVLNRFAPDGTIERRIEVPMAAPTMPCFGGPDMRTLYVTGLTRNSATNPAKGSLISFRVDVAGAPIARFGEPFAQPGS